MHLHSASIWCLSIEHRSTDDKQNILSITFLKYSHPSAKTHVLSTEEMVLLSTHNMLQLGNTVDVRKFQTSVVSQKGIDKQCRPRSFRSSLIRAFPVCYSDKHFVNHIGAGSSGITLLVSEFYLRTEREKCSKF